MSSVRCSSSKKENVFGKYWVGNRISWRWFWWHWTNPCQTHQKVTMGDSHNSQEVMKMFLKNPHFISFQSWKMLKWPGKNLPKNVCPKKGGKWRMAIGRKAISGCRSCHLTWQRPCLSLKGISGKKGIFSQEETQIHYNFLWFRGQMDGEEKQETNLDVQMPEYHIRVSWQKRLFLDFCK